jgi:hypothetical protein
VQNKDVKQPKSPRWSLQMLQTSFEIFKKIRTILQKKIKLR